MSLSLGTPITKNFGAECRLVYFEFNVRNQYMRAVWETHDGTSLSGKTFAATVNADGTTYEYTDGTKETVANPKFSAAAVQALVDQTKLDAVGQAKVK